MTVKAKICGLKDEQNINAAIENGADYLGFVFYPKSPRNISIEEARDLATIIKDDATKIAVVVDPDDELLGQIKGSLGPDYFQLHGDESVERVKEIKEKFNIKVIKAIKVNEEADIDRVHLYQAEVEMLLFDRGKSDNMPGSLPGGTGMAFNWELLAGQDFQVPWMLSGGLNSGNVKEAIEITGAKIVDVSSGVEITPGEKSPELIKEFLDKVKSIND